jgi:hypothetical protein
MHPRTHPHPSQPDMPQPRYFPPGSEQPRPLPEASTPTFKVRGALPPGSPESVNGVQELLDRPDSAPAPHSGFGEFAQDPRITDSVLEAMNELERLFTGGPVLVAPAPGAEAPRPPRSLPPSIPAGTPTRDVSPEWVHRSRGNLVPLALAGLMGVAVAAGATFGIVRVRRVSNVHSTRRSPMAVSRPTPVIAGYLARAEAGDPVAMRLLMTCYRDGLDTPVDAVEASRWALRAALAEPPAPALAQVVPAEPMTGVQP